MRVSLICSKCGKVIRIGNGRVDLTCQICGGYDFRLESPIIASPILPGGIAGRREEFRIDDSFTGKHKNGSSWLVEMVREWKTKESESEVVVKKEEPVVIVKKEEPVAVKKEEPIIVIEVVEKKEEEKPKEEKAEEKPSLAKSVRKLRARINQ